MGDSTSTGNVMTVELAIQRELEYRQKVKMYGLQPFGHSGWTEFLPLQVPVSSSNMSPTVPATKSNNLQNRMPDPSPVPAQTTSSKKPTLSSTSTRCPAPLPAKRKAEIGNDDSHMDRYFCSICQVPCSGASNYKMHIRGRQHAAKLENGRVYSYMQGSVIMTPHRCELCKISCPDEKALQMHFEGQKHLSRLHKLESNEECGAEEEASVRKWCGLCKIWCMNESLFKQHLQGRKHTSNLHLEKES